MSTSIRQWRGLQSVRKGCLHEQPHQALGFHKRARMRHHACENLRAGYWLIIPTGKQALSINLPGYMLRTHAVSGIGEEEYDGFFQFHIATDFGRKLQRACAKLWHKQIFFC